MQILEASAGRVLDWLRSRAGDSQRDLPPSVEQLPLRLPESRIDPLAWHIVTQVGIRSGERGIALPGRPMQRPLAAELRRTRQRLLRSQRETLESLEARPPPGSERTPARVEARRLAARAETLRRLRRQLSRGIALVDADEEGELAERLAEVLVAHAPPGFLSVGDLRSLPAMVTGWISEILDR